MENQDPDKEDIIRAKQAISPAGLANQSAEGASGGPSSEVDSEEPAPDQYEDEYMDGDKLGANVHELHRNRNADGKVDIGKGSYS